MSDRLPAHPIDLMVFMGLLFMFGPLMVSQKRLTKEEE